MLRVMPWTRVNTIHSLKLPDLMNHYTFIQDFKKKENSKESKLDNENKL